MIFILKIGWNNFCILKIENKWSTNPHIPGDSTHTAVFVEKKGKWRDKEKHSDHDRNKLMNMFGNERTDALLAKQSHFPASISLCKVQIFSHCCSLKLTHHYLPCCQCGADWAVIVLTEISSFSCRAIGSSSIWHVFCFLCFRPLKQSVPLGHLYVTSCIILRRLS